jgi:Cdc6-like AAA superfamily ATPase
VDEGFEQPAAKVVENDVVQTFRNFVNAIVTHQVKGRMKRDGLLILLDEFDVIRDKHAVGSIIKSLSSDHVKFAICGIADDLAELVHDHASVERLVEEGALHVRPMSTEESKDIIHTAEKLFEGNLSFDPAVADEIANISQGYPYFTQQLGKLASLRQTKLA